MDSIKPAIIFWAALIALVALAAGCASAAAKGRNEQARSLKLFAFNYTDRYLMNITVDGMWMGGASAYKQGGGAMGPRPPRDRTRSHAVEVEWEVSGRYDMAANSYERMPVERRTASVPIKFPYPENPNELVLHFYPDGRVEAEMIGREDNVFDFRRTPVCDDAAPRGLFCDPA